MASFDAPQTMRTICSFRANIMKIGIMHVCHGNGCYWSQSSDPVIQSRSTTAGGVL